MAINSKILLCKDIKMDKSYANVVNYTEQQMLELCQSSEHLVASSSNYSFIRTQNVIHVGFTYSQCLNSNYIAFQNPNYSNKWFFAWIDDVKYISNGTTEISFTIDAWSTWFSNITPKTCFVEREHVNSDNIGEHTIPEGLETGDYIMIEKTTDSHDNSIHYILGSTLHPGDLIPLGGGVYGGVPSAISYYAYDTVNELNRAIAGLQDGHEDAIQSVFVAPQWLSPKTATSIVAQSSTPHTYNFTVSKIDYLDDNFIPKNKKLLTYPYCYFYVSNSQGSSTILKNELWELTNNYLTFKIIGSLTPGCSIRAIPQNYDGIPGDNWDEGLTLGKFPSLNWVIDDYRNWQAQQGLNLFGIHLNYSQGRLFKGLGQIATGDIDNGISKIFGGMQEEYQHSLVPMSVSSSTNSADVSFAYRYNQLIIAKMTIKEEFARVIDDYLTRFGYKVNSLKVPNITGRTYWNFIKIGSNEEIGNGSIPNNYMEEINSICSKGVTIWHNHDNIGNFNLDNSIIQ